MSCQIGKLDLCVRHGDTAQKIDIEIYFSDSEGNYQEVPENLTGYKFFFEIRNGDSVVKAKSLTSGLSSQGSTLTINQIPEINIEAGSYTYAMKMIEPNGIITTFLEGKYDVKKEIVTHPNT